MISSRTAFSPGERAGSPMGEASCAGAPGEGRDYEDAPPGLPRYSFISISLNVRPNPDNAKALEGSVSAGTDTRLDAANTDVWSWA